MRSFSENPPWIYGGLLEKRLFPDGNEFRGRGVFFTARCRAVACQA
ncbi:MAG: hypothetical protein PVI06_02780 [Desulfobacterales bacterium]